MSYLQNRLCIIIVICCEIVLIFSLTFDCLCCLFSKQPNVILVCNVQVHEEQMDCHDVVIAFPTGFPIAMPLTI